MGRGAKIITLLAICVTFLTCGGEESPKPSRVDSGIRDAGRVGADAGTNAPAFDAGQYEDAGTPQPVDGGTLDDTGPAMDAGPDAGFHDDGGQLDAGGDAGMDGGVPELHPIEDDGFMQEIPRFSPRRQEPLAEKDPRLMALFRGLLYIATSNGIYIFDPETGDSKGNIDTGSPVTDLATSPDGDSLWAVSGKTLILIADDKPKTLKCPCDSDIRLIAPASRSFAFGIAGNEPEELVAIRVQNGSCTVDADDIVKDWFEPVEPLTDCGPIRDLLFANKENGFIVAAGGESGLCITRFEGDFDPQSKPQGARGIKFDLRKNLPSENVRGLTISDDGRLVAATDKGVVIIGSDLKLEKTLVEEDGMPWVDTVRAAFFGDQLWIATGWGAIRYDPQGRHFGQKFHYYAGWRWMPGNEVRDVLVTDQGTIWFTTDKGIQRIEVVPMTLEEKAAHYDEITRLRHNRYGMIAASTLDVPADLSSNHTRDDDNDGQWTQMYIAAESFHYAVTKDPQVKEWLRESVKAMIFLEEVTPISGFPARSVVPIEDCQNNPQRYNPEQWHPADDGKWCWKGDTSSDEITGHLFGFPIFYDLAADDNEKQEVAEVVHRIVSHIIDHGYKLIDIDGEPTTHGHWDPQFVNEFPGPLGDGGLNSAMMLAYLLAAYHMTGDEKFMEHYHYLIDEHHYDDNVVHYQEISTKVQVNHDSDEMALMMFYILLRYETDPKLRRKYMKGLRLTMEVQAPERQPEFNIIYQVYLGKDFHNDDTLRTLIEYPWDLISWPMHNSHRLDVELDPKPDRFGAVQSLTVLPYDELPFKRPSQNPYALDADDRTAQSEEAGTFWLLPYWMGRYHGIIKAPED